MAVSKRTRFEVLKRDNHTCRYCGATPPDTVLHVDHVIPVALGGSDNPDNLVAACKDCNLGKSSTQASDEVVNEVNEQALAYSQALRERIKEITGTAKGLRQTRLNLEARWEELSDEHGYYKTAPLDENWGSTLSRWLSVGLEEDFLLDAMEIAFSKYGVSRSDRYRYFCGVVYRTLDNAHEQVQEGPSGPKTCGHCDVCMNPQDYGSTLEETDKQCVLYGVNRDDGDVTPCEVCGKTDCAYNLGKLDGIQEGMQFEWNENYDAIMHYRNCPEVDRGA